MAFERNWDLLAARSDVDAATAQRLIAHEFPNPTVSLSTSKVSMDNHGNGSTMGNGLLERSYDTILAVNQLFEVGGKRRHRQVSVEAGLAGGRARLWDARRVLDLAISKAYAAAVLAEANVQVLRQSSETLRKETRIAQDRFNAGDISRADKSQIEITAERFELDAQTASANARTARITLENLMGIPKPSGEILLSDNLETLAVSLIAGESPGPGAARADIVAAEQAVKKAEADLRLQKAYRIPDPTVSLQYERNPGDLPNTIGVGVSFPLPLWNNNRGNIKAAEAAREQSSIELERAKAMAAADIAIAGVAHDEARKRWLNYRDSIRPKSAQILETLTYSYRKGGATVLDLLSAERNDNDIRMATLQALSDTATAAAALKAAREALPTETKHQ